MESSEDIRSPRTSRFLQLPRELRDLIYENVLVKDIIPIECAVTRQSPSLPYRRGSGNPPLNWTDEVYLLRASWVHRRVWSVPAFDIDLGLFNDNHSLPDSVYMTYQIEKETGNQEMNCVGINLFQVCKQIYEEASKMFYSRNVFSFTSDFRIPCAFAFLCDRPAASLRNIKSLELSLMEANNLRGTTNAPYPVVTRSTDSLVLLFAYQYFTELCTLLSTSRINLQNLYLTIESTASFGDGGHIGLRDSLQKERLKMNCPGPWIPIWLDPLLKIEGLELLEMRWFSDRPQMLRMTDTMDLIQQHMITGDPRRHTSHVMTECTGGSESLKLRLQHDESPDVLQHSDDEDWRRIILDNDGLQYAKVIQRDEEEEFRRFTGRPYCREILEGHSNAYASFFKLKSA